MKTMDMSLAVEPIEANMVAEGIVIYTFESTGNPKGVVHDFYSMGAVVARNTIHDHSDKTERNNIVGLVAPFPFVVSTGLFLAVLQLAKHIVIVPDEIRKDLYKLAKYYDDNDLIYDISNQGWASAQWAFRFYEDTDINVVTDLIQQAYNLKKSNQ